MNDFTFAHREEGFDNHIEMSIRGYSNLHDDVVSLSRYFVDNESSVYDIGSSTGKTILAMAEQNYSFAPYCHYIGVEIADGFEDAMNNRVLEVENKFPGTSVRYLKEDIRDTIIKNASLVTSLFTLQFMPRNARAEVIDRIYEGLNEGGAFIFGEKTVATDARIQDMMTFTYYDYKRKSFSEADIMGKEVTLRNMLKPNTWEELEQMIYDAGFKSVQPFWQNFMFVGAIAVK